MSLRWTVLIASLLFTLVLADSNSWHKFGIGTISRVFPATATYSQFIAASDKGVVARLYVDDLSTVWRSSPIHIDDMFESIFIVDDDLVISRVKRVSNFRTVRVYSLSNGTILWEAPACAQIGTVNMANGDEEVESYMVVEKCSSDGTKGIRYLSFLDGIDVSERLEQSNLGGVMWFEDNQGAGKLMDNGATRWSGFKSMDETAVELYSFRDARFVVREKGKDVDIVTRHEAVAHTIDSTFVSSGNDTNNALDTVVLFSEFGSLFAFDFLGAPLWSRQLPDKKENDKCLLTSGSGHLHSIVVVCVGGEMDVTRVTVVNGLSGLIVLNELVSEFHAVHAYLRGTCCSKKDQCVVLVNALGERRFVSTCDVDYVSTNALVVDETLYISAQHGGKTVEGYLAGDKPPEWRFELPHGLSIVNVALKRPVSSVSRRGRLRPFRVTEDRKLLRKYIDPTSTLVLAKHEESVNGAIMAVVLDGNSGVVLKALNHVNASAPYTAVGCDNWFVYSFWNTYLLQQELHVIDMYERKEDTSFIVEKMVGMLKRNFPIALRLLKNYAPGALSEEKLDGTCTGVDASGTCEVKRRKSPELLHTAFVISHQVIVLQHSETEGGITENSVLLGLGNGQVVSLSRLAVDARRPINGEYASAESLYPYYPYISFLPSESAAQFVTSDMYLSGLKGVAVAPVSRRESSCHVVVYGVDVYYRMLEPAGSFDMLPDDFGFSTVLGSVLLILGAMLYSKNTVERKVLYEAWYSS